MDSWLALWTAGFEFRMVSWTPFEAQPARTTSALPWPHHSSRCAHRPRPQRSLSVHRATRPRTVLAIWLAWRFLLSGPKSSMFDVLPCLLPRGVPLLRAGAATCRAFPVNRVFFCSPAGVAGQTPEIQQVPGWPSPAVDFARRRGAWSESPSQGGGRRIESSSAYHLDI